MLITRHASKPCCGNCQSGKPCCGTKLKPQHKPPPFHKRHGIWLPRRELSIPKNLLQYPSEAEWSGLWRPWMPALVKFDMSCLPCCNPNCTECDPGLNDPGYPMAIDDLNVTISGAISATDVLPVASDCGSAGSWSYANTLIILDAAGCGDAGWISVSLCVFCDPVSGSIKANFTGGSGSCAINTPNEREADSWTCSPFSATWTYETGELVLGGCPCGDGTPITVVVSE